MEPQSVDELERHYRLKFPALYRSILLICPLTSASEELCIHPDQLRISNNSCRERGVWDLKWPDNLWWIGDDGCGGIFFINCDETDGLVYYFDHEDAPNSFDEMDKMKFKSLDEFVASIEEGERQFQKDCDDLLLKIKNRKWWQFWVPRTPPPWAVRDRLT